MNRHEVLIMVRPVCVVLLSTLVLGALHTPGFASRWRTYGTSQALGFNSSTYAATEFRGELYVGGYFYFAGPTRWMPKIARWDGSSWQRVGRGVDDWPCPELSCDASVRALAADSTYLYVGGYFPSVDEGLPAAYVARWDGQRWTAMGAGFNSQVLDLVIYQGDVIACGGFTETAGSPVGRIARWDGTTWQPLSTGMNGGVLDLTVWGDKLVASGIFTQAGGASILNIACWDGSSWSSLGEGLNFSGPLTVHEGNLLTTGVVSGMPQVNGILRWDGHSWTRVTGLPSTGSTLVMQEFDGNLVIGGSFTSVGNHIATWNGSSWNPMEGGVDDRVLAMEVVNGELLVFGDFLRVNGFDSSFIAAWRSATPVHLSDFRVAALPDGVHLQWQLSLESLAELTSVVVQRSLFAEGPFQDVSGHLLPRRSMEFTDVTAVVGEEYWYRLAGRTQAGVIETSLAVSTRIQPLAESFLYPPILDGDRVQVRYQLANHVGPIRLGIYDVRGRLVRSLATGSQPPGEYRLLWDGTLETGTRVSRGVYFLNLQARDTHLSRKVVLSRH